MTNEDFNSLNEKLKRIAPKSGGPLKIKSLDSRTEILDLNNILLDPSKRDYIIHIKYFPEENRYGFAVYKGEK